MKHSNLYFRLSLIWLAMISGGLAWRSSCFSRSASVGGLIHRAFGFNPSSAHFRATSSTLSGTHGWIASVDKADRTDPAACRASSR
jgi:hypothetical protein